MDAEGAALSTEKFWDDRYKNADGEEPTHEWFRSFDSLQPFLSKHLYAVRTAESNPRLIHLGCGDSTVPRDLAVLKGYTNQICIDFSQIVVNLMKTRYADIVAKGQVEWIHGDVRDMSVVSSKSIDVAFDKGTLDAMIHGSPWSPPEPVLKNTGEYINEVFRVLKDDGIFLYITFRQPHFVKPLLNRDNSWNLVCETLNDGAGSFDYFCFTLTKSLSLETAER